MNLFREIHRRSMWQVLGIYLGASWVMLQIVDTLAGALGLPDWSASFALFLLIIGLPIVLATAFLQGGMSTAKPVPEPQSLSDVGEVPPAPAAEVTGARRFLTWRRAFLGGGAAFALLGVLTAVYLFMRTAGIGPAGTLVAQGVLEEGARVILADFESSDVDLADVVGGALRIDLLQSPTIRIVEPSELSAGLRRMQREGDTPITSDVARELATREGYGAVIEGEVGVAGSGYVLTANVMGGEGWTSLAAFRATATNDDNLLDAIEELSRDIRDKAGESLRSVQGAPPLRDVTTRSLEALRAYTRGEELSSAGDHRGALELFERATEIDPEFAMAHRKIAVALGNLVIRRADEVAAITRAYELRERLPENERYLAEAYHAERVLADDDAAILAYERQLEIDPDNTAALNNLGNILTGMARFAEADSLYMRALGVEAFEGGYLNLSRSQMAQWNREDAERTLDEAITRIPEASYVFENWRVDFALQSADFGVADSLAESYRARFTQPARATGYAAVQRFYLDASRGRLEAAESYIDQFTGVPVLGNPLIGAGTRARLHLQRGDQTAAVQAVMEGLDAHRGSVLAGDREYGFLIAAVLDAGEVQAAESLQEEANAETPVAELGGGDQDWFERNEAHLAALRGDSESALELWETHERTCPGDCAIFSAIRRARALDANGDAAAAVEEYERYLTAPAVFKAYWNAAERAGVLERLGQLYDQLEDFENATKYYAMFVELWAEADEELQPRVRAAQARLEEILSERG